MGKISEKTSAQARSSPRFRPSPMTSSSQHGRTTLGSRASPRSSRSDHTKQVPSPEIKASGTRRDPQYSHGAKRRLLEDEGSDNKRHLVPPVRVELRSSPRSSSLNSTEQALSPEMKASGTSRDTPFHSRAVKRQLLEMEEGDIEQQHVRSVRVKLQHAEPDSIKELTEGKLVLDWSASDLLKDLAERRRMSTSETDEPKGGGPCSRPLKTLKESSLEKTPRSVLMGTVDDTNDNNSATEQPRTQTETSQSGRVSPVFAGGDMSKLKILKHVPPNNTQDVRDQVSDGKEQPNRRQPRPRTGTFTGRVSPVFAYGISELPRLRSKPPNNAQNVRDQVSGEKNEPNQGNEPGRVSPVLANDMSELPRLRRKSPDKAQNVNVMDQVSGEKNEPNQANQPGRVSPVFANDLSSLPRLRRKPPDNTQDDGDQVSSEKNKPNQANQPERVSPVFNYDMSELPRLRRKPPDNARDVRNQVLVGKQQPNQGKQRDLPVVLEGVDFTRVDLLPAPTPSKTSGYDDGSVYNRVKWFKKPDFFTFGSEADSRPRLCMSCEGRKTSLAAFLEHTASRDARIPCRFCDNHSNSPCGERIHLMSDHQFVCDICSFQVKNKVEAFQHRQEQHPEEKRLDQKDLTAVGTFHGGPPINLWKMPKVKLLVYGITVGALSEPSPDGSSPYIVGIIPSASLTEKQSIARRYETFLELKALRSTRGTMCPLCPSMLSSIKDVMKHMVEAHRPRSFEQLEAAAISMKTPFCEICKYYFQDLKSLKRHTAYVHTVSTPNSIALSQRATRAQEEGRGNGGKSGIHAQFAHISRETTGVETTQPPVPGNTQGHLSMVSEAGKNTCIIPANQAANTVSNSTDASSQAESFNSSTKVDERKSLSGNSSGHSQTDNDIGPPLGPDTTGTERDATNVPSKLAAKPFVIRSRCNIEGGSWDLPGSLFRPQTLPQVEPLIQSTLNDLKFQVTAGNGWMLREAGGPVSTGSIAAYMKLRPVLDNPPRTPTARQNYYTTKKYKIPMGHFAPEFEETPLFPTLRDIYMRTKGYKRSPLRIVTRREIKKLSLVELPGRRRLKKGLAKHLSVAIEMAFMAKATQCISEARLAHSLPRLSNDMHAHSVLSNWVGHCIRQRINNVRRSLTQNTVLVTSMPSTSQVTQMVVNNQTGMRHCPPSTINAGAYAIPSDGTSQPKWQIIGGATHNGPTMHLGQPRMVRPIIQGTNHGQPATHQAMMPNGQQMFLLRRPTGSYSLLTQGPPRPAAQDPPRPSAQDSRTPASTTQQQMDPSLQPMMALRPPPPLYRAPPALYLAAQQPSALPTKPRTVSAILSSQSTIPPSARMVDLGNGQQVFIVRSSRKDPPEASGEESGHQNTVRHYLAVAKASTSGTLTPTVSAKVNSDSLKTGNDNSQSYATSSSSFVGTLDSEVEKSVAGDPPVSAANPLQPPSSISTGVHNSQTPLQSVPSAENTKESNPQTLLQIVPCANNTKIGTTWRPPAEVIPGKSTEASDVQILGAPMSAMTRTPINAATSESSVGTARDSLLLSSAHTQSKAAFTGQVKLAIHRALTGLNTVNSRQSCPPPPLVQMVPMPQGEQHRATSTLIRPGQLAAAHRLSPPPVVRVSPMRKLTMVYKDGTSLTLPRGKMGELEAAAEPKVMTDESTSKAVKTNKYVDQDRKRFRRSNQWYLRRQHKRKKYERKLKQKLRLGKDYLDAPILTKTIKQTPMATKHVVFKAVDVGLVLKVSEAVKRGRRARITLDGYWDLFYRYVNNVSMR